MSDNKPNLRKDYRERIVPELMKHFGYKSIMQVPRLNKIVVNQGIGIATGDKKPRSAPLRINSVICWAL